MTPSSLRIRVASVSSRNDGDVEVRRDRKGSAVRGWEGAEEGMGGRGLLKIRKRFRSLDLIVEKTGRCGIGEARSNPLSICCRWARLRTPNGDRRESLQCRLHLLGDHSVSPFGRGATGAAR